MKQTKQQLETKVEELKEKNIHLETLLRQTTIDLELQVIRDKGLKHCLALEYLGYCDALLDDFAKKKICYRRAKNQIKLMRCQLENFTL